MGVNAAADDGEDALEGTSLDGALQRPHATVVRPLRAHALEEGGEAVVLLLIIFLKHLIIGWSSGGAGHHYQNKQTKGKQKNWKKVLKVSKNSFEIYYQSRTLHCDVIFFGASEVVW